MCGVVGVVCGPQLKADRDTVLAMLERIRHRGPDAGGLWTEDNVWLGHRRLSIIDLSPAGAQPMASHCGRYVASFNGEIYNYQDLRGDIETRGNVVWRGTSDTEVLIELIARDGFGRAVEQLNGMFALAVWDRREKTLSLARDRFGEKPLYYGEHGGGLVFASELGAIEAHDGFPKEIDAEALTSYLRWGAVPAPQAIYRRVRKLPPGCIVTFGPTGLSGVSAYWSIADVARRGVANPIRDEREIIDRLEAALAKSCRQKMVSDVPLGAFLSGGVDSSAVAALMQAQSSRPIKTFTIGFDIPKYNEAEYAKAVARHLGTDHAEQILTERDALDVAPRLGAFYDEPFADSSAIPTYLVSRMAREHVTVCLSGDGGDELFAGYTRYFIHPEMWGWISKVPMRRAAGRALRAIPPSSLNYLLAPLKAYEGRVSRSEDGIGVKAHRLAERLGVEGFEDYYRKMMMFVPDAGRFVRGASAGDGAPVVTAPEFADTLDWMCCADAASYLPNDILVKVDRASMAVSLESRTPFLDPEVAELAWRIPAQIKVREGEGKWPLRQVLYRHAPRELFDRPKMGFGVPLREWLRGPLREWACDLLSKERVLRQGYLNPAHVSACLGDFMTGRRPEPSKLWALLMWQSWLEARGR